IPIRAPRHRMNIGFPIGRGIGKFAPKHGKSAPSVLYWPVRSVPVWYFLYRTIVFLQMPEEVIPMEPYLVALDQGTTSSRAILFNRAGEILARAQYPFRQIYPQPGWVEHDPMEIWATEKRALAEAVNTAHIDPKQIAAVGITNQRETTIVWDRRTGEPIYNAIVWQCRRTASICDRLVADGLSDLVRSK